LKRLELYAELVEQAAAPLGGLWDNGVTALQLGDEAEIELATVSASLAWWSKLVEAL
jgi:hypothetical protein